MLQYYGGFYDGSLPSVLGSHIISHITHMPKQTALYVMHVQQSADCCRLMCKMLQQPTTLHVFNLKLIYLSKLLNFTHQHLSHLFVEQQSLRISAGTKIHYNNYTRIRQTILSLHKYRGGVSLPHLLLYSHTASLLRAVDWCHGHFTKL